MKRFTTWLLDRGVVLAAALVATAAALIASYAGLCGVAGLGGWSASVRPMLPLTVDVIAVAAGVLVQRTRNAELREHAWRGVRWATVVSVVGNAVDHLWVISHSGDMQSVGAWVRVVLAVLISACPAIGIAYVVHLLALMTGTEAAAAEAAPITPPPAKQAAPTAPAPAARASVFSLPAARTAPPARTNTARAQGLRMIAAARANGVTLTSDDLASSLGCTTRYAQKLLSA